MLLYDMNGICRGVTQDEVAPEGYFLRDDDAPNDMSALQFLDKIGPERFAAIWQTSLQSPAMAFQLMRGLAAQYVVIEESFPTLIQMEQIGLLPEGTAMEVWA